MAWRLNVKSVRIILKRNGNWRKNNLYNLAGVAQLVEHPICNRKAIGSSPILGSTLSAHVAQMVEHILGKDEVTSSILVVGSILVA